MNAVTSIYIDSDSVCFNTEQGNYQFPHTGGEETLHTFECKKSLIEPTKIFEWRTYIKGLDVIEDYESRELHTGPREPKVYKSKTVLCTIPLSYTKRHENKKGVLLCYD